MDGNNREVSRVQTRVYPFLCNIGLLDRSATQYAQFKLEQFRIWKFLSRLNHGNSFPAAMLWGFFFVRDAILSELLRIFSYSNLYPNSCSTL